MDAGSSLRWLAASTMTECHHFDSISDAEPQNLSQVGWVSSSLGNQTAAGSYRYDSWQLQIWDSGDFLYFSKVSTYQFQRSSEEFYDYSWQLYISKLVATCSTLLQNFVSNNDSYAEIFRHRPLITRSSTMASAASPSPDGTKMMSNTYPMAHAAS